MTYAELLKHPKWQRKRLEALQAADFKCSRCGADEVTLHVHHIEYIKGNKPWEYELSELAVLCELCHGEEHNPRSILDGIVAFIPPDKLYEAAALLAGYACARSWLKPEEIHTLRPFSIAPFFAGASAAKFLDAAPDLHSAPDLFKAAMGE